MDPFKIVSTSTESGPRLFVAVDTYFGSPLLAPGDTNILLTVDAADMDEMDGLIDELIDELNHLRKSADFQFKMIDNPEGKLR